MVLTGTFFILSSIVYLCSAGGYENNILLRATVRNNEDIEKMMHIEGLDVWNEAASPNQPILASADARHNNSSLKALDDMKIKYEIVSYNLQEIIDKEAANLKRVPRLPGGEFNFETYNTLSSINKYMKSLDEKYPNQAKVFSIGTTYKKRTIFGVIIRKNIAETKSIVFFECGIHAREWISPATCLWIINELLTKPNSLLDKFEFHIIPVLNPDGYHYTWFFQRLWRKNRSYYRDVSLLCTGTDLNRNFDISFCGPGTSKNPCSEIYCGKSAFSEDETKALSDYVFKLKDSITCYFSIHSYSQLWMFPYGYKRERPENFDELESFSITGVKALHKVYGTNYKEGTISETIYEAAGASVDWVYDIAGIKMSFTLELRDQGEYGFLLPPWFIVPTAIETYVGITAALEKPLNLSVVNFK